MLSHTVLIPEENVGFVVLTTSESSAFTNRWRRSAIVRRCPETRLECRCGTDAANKAADAEEIKKADAA